MEGKIWYKDRAGQLKQVKVRERLWLAHIYGFGQICITFNLYS